MPSSRTRNGSLPVGFTLIRSGDGIAGYIAAFKVGRCPGVGGGEARSILRARVDNGLLLTFKTVQQHISLSAWLHNAIAANLADSAEGGLRRSRS